MGWDAMRWFVVVDAEEWPVIDRGFEFAEGERRREAEGRTRG